jgi:hypothetical protein
VSVLGHGDNLPGRQENQGGDSRPVGPEKRLIAAAV